jgi:hypothetical protein
MAVQPDEHPTVGANLIYAQRLFPWLNEEQAELLGHQIGRLNQGLVRRALQRFALSWREGPCLGALVGEVKAECQRAAPSHYGDGNGRKLGQDLLGSLRAAAAADRSDADLLTEHFSRAWRGVSEHPGQEPLAAERVRVHLYRQARKAYVDIGWDDAAADGAARACCGYGPHEKIIASSMLRSVREDEQRERDQEQRTRLDVQRQLSRLAAAELKSRPSQPSGARPRRKRPKGSPAAQPLASG